MMHKQRGVALIVVLLIVALVATIATNISSRNQLSMRRTLNLAEYDQAYWYAISGEALAQKVLKQDLDDDKDRVHRQQYWAQSEVIFPVENGSIGGKISDMRACFNLNALSVADPKPQSGQPKMSLAARQYQGLLVALGMDQFNAEKLTHTLKDYLDEDTVTSPFGAEDAEYESRHVPYRAANTLMNHRSELRAVMGYSQDLYKKLLPYICVIPGNDRQLLNVNTIEPEQAAVLAGMLENTISVAEAESVINQRPSDGFDNIEDFWKLVTLPQQADDTFKSAFVVNSDFFLLQVQAKAGEAVFRLDSVMQRDGNNKMKVITRQFGGQP